jgi:hypothetical protein
MEAIMNTKSVRLFISTAVVTLFLSFAVNLRAQAPPPPPPPANLSAATGLLNEAYAALSVADHDYKGHRVRAMHQIERAAKELGFSLGGSGHGHEQQVASDDQLHTAQGLLQQAVTGLPPKAQEHVQKAIEEISIALSIK